MYQIPWLATLWAPQDKWPPCKPPLRWPLCPSTPLLSPPTVKFTLLPCTTPHNPPSNSPCYEYGQHYLFLTLILTFGCPQTWSEDSCSSSDSSILISHCYVDVNRMFLGPVVNIYFMKWKLYAVWRKNPGVFVVINFHWFNILEMRYTHSILRLFHFNIMVLYMISSWFFSTIIIRLTFEMLVSQLNVGKWKLISPVFSSSVLQFIDIQHKFCS